MNKKELKIILDNHKLWLETKGKEGSRADLRDAVLIYVDLTSADLRGANLTSANLKGAVLTDANLKDANLTGADLRGTKTDKRYVSITCIGSEKRITIYCFDDDIVWCGCYIGSLKEFKDKVETTHKDNPQYLKEYLNAIKYIESLRSA